MNSPLLHRHLLPVAKAHTTLQLAALTGAILHKVQVKSSEGHTLQVIYKSSVEGGVRPPLLLPSAGGNIYKGQAASCAQRERTQWLPGEA